ncbi:MAG: probable rRNA maturation factor [Methyloprofundus sp.]|nr:MAG: probable rRNA maturation factor [Methyloprofundus sp.]
MLIRELEVQRVATFNNIPSDELFQVWVEKALSEYHKNAEIVIRIVDIKEITELNIQYRLKEGATNILSFPFDAPEGVEGINLLGDLVVCAKVLEQEAQAQQKLLNNHWAHIIIHGVLHLLGYDHINDKDALEMESKEIFILQQLDIENPYQEIETNG